MKCIEDEIPFEIPDSWMYIRFSSCFDLISGRDLPTDEHNNIICGTPYITGASNFSRGNISIIKWTSNPQVITEKGDILITCKGTVGEMAINIFGKAHIARQIMAIRNKYNMDNEYIYVCIKYYVDSLKELAQGLIPGISRDNILQLYLPIPPIAEQKRIAERVYSILSEISVIEKTIH